jgi:hypothetical protein
MKGKRKYRYDVKTIEWHEPDRATTITLMIVRFNGDGHQVLGRAGYSDESLMYMAIHPGAFHAHWKPRTFANDSGATQIKRFLVGLQPYSNVDDTPGWDEIEDGKQYTPEVYDR